MSLSPWAKRRKLIITTSIVGVLLVIFGVQAFRVLYEPPTCFDGRQNGGESGVDCGGRCERMCISDVREVRVEWVRAFKIRDGEYSVAAHIENPNTNADIKELPYTFKLLDASKSVITEVSGVTFAHANSSFPIFEGPLYVGREPQSVEIVFSEPYFIHTTNFETPLTVENSTLLSSETQPKISALVRNASISSIRDVEAVAVVYDGSTPIASSRTVVDYLQSDAEERITFTWPDAFKIEPTTCEQPVTTVLAIDRSGSMNDDGSDPPQPITDVLRAAETFVRNLRSNDKAGLVSYATNASSPIDLEPTFERSLALQGLSEVKILEEDETGYTNPGAAILSAREALVKDPAFRLGGRQSIIVLLTDGQANYPETPGGERYAEEQASLAKREGIVVYTIGLGENINRQFLGRVATSPEYYFEAASTNDLVGIYEEIGTAVCSLGPSIIEITPRYNTF